MATHSTTSQATPKRGTPRGKISMPSAPIGMAFRLPVTKLSLQAAERAQAAELKIQLLDLKPRILAAERAAQKTEGAPFASLVLRGRGG